MKPFITAIAGSAVALASPAVFAAGSHDGGHGHGHEAPIGRPGDAAKADRVIEVSMTEMAFDPSTIEVRAGETVTFAVTNDGDLVHEFNLGTEAMWQAHMDEMREMMETGMMSAAQIHHDRMMQAGMMHDDANSVLLEPGETARVTWTFGERTDLGFACNVPGHRASGMVGDIAFTTR
ncbi:cupredoxin domain-containing protein [Roseovarius ramblicola]|uniref:Plastocyanin/azurin family copper-binding protein n=1 Tax=Roseovarius ramblicola TaxID=2022336 RepID=A0ABV5I1G0_9RHOB